MSFDLYKEKMTHIVQNLDKDKSISQAGRLIGETYLSGGMLYAFGTGHSHMLALEMFYRAGGLVKVQPILEEKLMLHLSASQSTEYERTSGFAREIFSRYPVQAGDAVIIFSNSGRNAVPVEAAEYCKQLGAKVIAVTCLAQSSKAASRAPSGKKLYEVADLTIDNLAEDGDACVPLPDGKRIAPVSTAAGAVIVNLIEIAVVNHMASKGALPELFVSSNVDGGDAVNKSYIERYKYVLKGL